MRADSVLETLRRGAPEKNFREATARLKNAIGAGQGHIVVLGDSQREASVFVDSVLTRTDGYDVAQISIQRITATLRDDAAVAALGNGADSRSFLVVVHDADSASPWDLEELRSVLDVNCHAVEHIRLVLVGSTKLERALADPEARALSSRVGTHIRLVHKVTHKHAVPIIHRAAPRRWALVTSAVTGCAALLCVAAADVSQPGKATGLLATAGGELAKLGESIASLSPAGAVIRNAASSRTPAASAAREARTHAPGTAGTSEVSLSTALGLSKSSDGFVARVSNFVEKAAYAGARRPTTVIGSGVTARKAKSVARASAPSARRTAKAPVAKAAAAPTSEGGFFAALARLFAGDSSEGRSIEAKVAKLEAAAKGTKSRALRIPTRGGEIVEVGSFSHAYGAFELKSSLAPHFDRLAVARFDPPTGPNYRVRVFDLEGDQPQMSAAGVGTPVE